MSSGLKKMQINTQERAISPDINRLQAFRDRGLMELYRYMIDVSSGSDDLEAAAQVTEFSSLTAPAEAEIINGILVQPQAGVTDLFVSPGVLAVINPDTDTDASNYKYVRDVGVTTLGVINIAANGGGSPRIDVVVARFTEVVTETDNRDIFDPTTELFTAVSVTKATEGRLTYAVRSGSVGGGYASVTLTTGDIPICVASVPAGSANNNTVTFWDVRPLLNDRLFNAAKVTHDLPRKFAQHGEAVFNGGVNSLSGVFEKSLGDRRVGGRIRPGVPLTDAQSIDIMAAANTASGQALTNNSFWHVWLVVPFGLPRWARYTDGPSGRVPRSPRGIPVVSNVPPNKLGAPNSAVALPTSTGLGGSTTNAALIAAARTDGSATAVGMNSDGLAQHWQGNHPLIVGGQTATTATFTLTDNTHFPACARAIWVRIKLASTFTTLRVDNLVDPYIQLKNAAAIVVGQVQLSDLVIANPTAGTLVFEYGWHVRIPIVNEYPTTAPGSRDIVVNWTNAVATLGTAECQITAWELGD